MQVIRPCKRVQCLLLARAASLPVRAVPLPVRAPPLPVLCDENSARSN